MVYGFSALSLGATTRRTWPDVASGVYGDSPAVAVAPGDVRALYGLLAGELVRVGVYAFHAGEQMPCSVTSYDGSRRTFLALRFAGSVVVTVKQHGLRRIACRTTSRVTFGRILA